MAAICYSFGADPNNNTITRGSRKHIFSLDATGGTISHLIFDRMSMDGSGSATFDKKETLGMSVTSSIIATHDPIFFTSIFMIM